MTPIMMIGGGFIIAVMLLAAFLRFKPTLIKVEQGNAIVLSRAVSVPVFGGKGWSM